MLHYLQAICSTINYMNTSKKGNILYSTLSFNVHPPRPPVYVEIQGWESVLPWIRGSQLTCCAFVPHKESAAGAEVDMSHRAQHPGPTRDFSAIAMSRSRPGDSANSRRRSRERAHVACSLNPAATEALPKGARTEWPADSWFHLMKGENKHSSLNDARRETVNGFS